MSSVRCRLMWHDWDTWSEMQYGYGGLTQFRVCKRCGKIGYTSIYGNQVKKEDINKVIKKDKEVS